MSDLRTRRTLFAIDRTFFNLLKTHAFTDLNVSLICAETHITRSTFYQYYLDLDDWLERIVGRYTLEAQSDFLCRSSIAADLSALVAKLPRKSPMRC
jgi:AcrR family transcriptional regulator